MYEYLINFYIFSSVNLLYSPNGKKALQLGTFDSKLINSGPSRCCAIRTKKNTRSQSQSVVQLEQRRPMSRHWLCFQFACIHR